MNSPLRIATRASRLALWQANDVAGRLRSVLSDREVVLVEISTVGDRDRTQPLTQMGDTGLFTREVQRAILDGRAEIAVHSLKDLPTEPTPGLILGAVPGRASIFDALVLPLIEGKPVETDPSQPLRSLPEAARIGTGSPRRRAQILNARPDLQVEEIRGNVETRLRKLDAGEFDAVILAEAGLVRLGLRERISARLCPPLLYPAVGQGALGIECRSDDDDTRQLLRSISHPPTFASVLAERELLSTLRAGCHAPVGVETACDADDLSMTAVVLSQDGTERISASHTGSTATPEALGRRLAESLLSDGAAELIGIPPS